MKPDDGNGDKIVAARLATWDDPDSDAKWTDPSIPDFWSGIVVQFIVFFQVIPGIPKELYSRM